MHYIFINDFGFHFFETMIDDFFFHSANQDFVVKFKNENVSLKNLLKLLRQHNITVPQEKRFLDAVIRANRSSDQSCKGRCFLEERSEAKWCYCDKTCKTWGDCCLDFQTR